VVAVSLNKINTRAEILQARDDYLAGRMGVLEERS